MIAKNPWRQLDAFTDRRADSYEVRYLSSNSWVAIDPCGNNMGTANTRVNARKLIDERRPYDWQQVERVAA